MKVVHNAPIEPIYLRLARRLREIRLARGMTQGELARRIGWTRTAVVNLEMGRQRIWPHTLAAMARVLGARATVEVRRRNRKKR